MQMQGKAQRVTIYIGEQTRHHGRPLYIALLETLHSVGAMGATVTRGIAGFGAGSRIHTASIMALSTDLPIRVEWVDHPERIDVLVPRLREMIGDGLITVEPIEVIQYAGGRRPDPLAEPVRNIMRTAVTTVQVDTPVSAIIPLLIDRGYRTLPVVDEENRLVGIITDGDLIRHANLPARLGLYGSLPPEVIRAQFTEIAQKGSTAKEILTKPVVTAGPDDSLRLVVAKMNLHDLKRLPVTDNGLLIGLVTRLDLLRTLEYHGRQAPPPGREQPRGGHSIRELMNAVPAAVSPQASLEEIVDALEASSQQRVLVVDNERHVIGIISDGDILRRSQEGENPGLLQRLRGLVVSGESADNVTLRLDERAAELMTTPVFTIDIETSLDEALRLMLRHRIKRLPVVNEHKQLIGLLGRSSLLYGLVGEMEDHADEHATGQGT